MNRFLRSLFLPFFKFIGLSSVIVWKKNPIIRERKVIGVLVFDKIPNDLIVGFSFGFALLSSITIVSHVSGAHLNPGISLTLATTSKFPWIKLAHYIPAQYLGSFVGTAAVYGIYHHIIKEYKEQYKQLIEANKTTPGIQLYAKETRFFASSPHQSINMVTAMSDSILSCAIFMLIIMAVIDEKNKIPKSFQPFLIFWTFVGVILGFFVNCGASLNPALDLSARLMAAIVYDFDVFKPLDYCYWWASQQLGLFIGFLIGGWTYFLLFEYRTTGEKQNNP